MKKLFPLISFCLFFYFYSSAQNNNDCWTLINSGIDIYNGQYNNNEFPGYHDPQTTDLKEVNGGFLTTGQYNKQTFDSNDNNIYTNLEDKDGSYLTKHSYNGNLIWIVYTEKNINSYRDVMFGSVEDNEGNIYVIGHSDNGAFFDSNGTQTTFINTNNFSSGFIVKLNSDGELLWHITIDNVFSKKINIDDDGNILLSGDISIYNNFKFNLYLNGVITDNLSNFEIMGNNSNYVNRGILKINPEGELLWYTSIKTNGANSEFLIDIGSDKNNNIYVTGYCSFNAEIYSAGKTTNPNIISWVGNPTKTFLIKFDKEGQFLWKVKTLLDDPEINGVQAWSTTVDEQGNSYITGSNDRWRKNIDQIFENTDGSITSENVGTFFIAKVNTNGICEWIKGAAHSYSGTGYKVIKSNDEIIVVGSIRGFNTLTEDVEFLSMDGNNIEASINTADYFLAIYDTDGNVDRIVTNGINDQRFFVSDRISGFFKDSNDNYYISRNIWFYTDGPKNYENFGHIINGQDLDGIDGTITKFNEGCGLVLGNIINTNMPSLSFCDNTSVGTDSDGLIKFDLTQNEDEIFISEPFSDYQISYYKDLALTAIISNPKTYENTIQKEIIYIKAEHLSDPDKSGQTFFNIEVIELPNVNPIVELKQCDNSDINGYSFFNLNEVKEEIIINPENYTITFHEEKALAENKGTAIINITKYKNEQVSVDKIWARTENNNGCYSVSEIDLFISTTQIPATLLTSFYQCDDGANTTDGIATFDFSAVTNDIINVFPASQQLIINYYRNEDDALSEENAITDITNYQNIGYPNQQNIYIRVDSKFDNDCLGLGAHISLNVEKIPIANTVSINPECDNDRDGFYSFNTLTIQSTIIGSQTNVAVNYFDESGIQLSSPLPNPFVTSSQTITAKITNTLSQDLDGQCSDETIINFIVNSVPIAYFIATQEECDDDTDGIIGFNTSTIESQILNGQTGLIVTYFNENNTELQSPLPNPFYTTSQTIRVRLENPVYDICYEETAIDFIVRQKPTFDLIKEAIICIKSNPQLEITIKNPNDINSYVWKNENNVTISNQSKATVVKGGIYKVIATSKYGCNSEEQKILVRESSVATITINDIEVQDDSENNNIQISTSNLGLGNYKFRLLDENESIVFDYQEQPYFENLKGGVYTIEVNDENGCGKTSFEVSLLEFPHFFTPNNDGKNDTWQIKGISKNFYKSGNISIFNRYGKLISTFTIDDFGWDGTYNGNVLSTNDYWFYTELVDQKDVSRSRRGNFSLIRK
tara:strand:- start:312 stop:4133 length:3822 start_codon:yes stop_codon:yes gene_type:complete